jgi:hypothetical protein
LLLLVPQRPQCQHLPLDQEDDWKRRPLQGLQVVERFAVRLLRCLQELVQQKARLRHGLHVLVRYSKLLPLDRQLATVAQGEFAAWQVLRLQLIVVYFGWQV